MSPPDPTSGESGQPKIPVSGLLSRAARTIASSSFTVALRASAASPTYPPRSSSITPSQAHGPHRLPTDVARERRLGPNTLRRHVRGPRDQTLDLREFARRDGGRSRGCVVLSHREDPLDDLALLHLLRRRGRERGVRPDRPAADLLAARESLGRAAERA